MTSSPHRWPLDIAASKSGAGFVGIAAMTSSMWPERHARRRLRGPIDYDASTHVVTLASNLLRISSANEWQRRGLFLAVPEGCRSLVGLGYVGLRRLAPKDAATTLYATCQTMAFVLFPTLGETPKPWRWPTDMLVPSHVQRGHLPRRRSHGEPRKRDESCDQSSATCTTTVRICGSAS